MAAKAKATVIDLMPWVNGCLLCIRGSGCVLVTLGFSLIAVTLYLYFHTVMPLLVALHSVPGLLVFLLASLISFNLLFNYVMVCCVAPGTPDMTVSREEAEKLETEAVPMRGKGWSRWCKSCKKPKPPRAHHCHICGHCVLKMDHHCPWINQCVGHHNHRYFFLSLLWMWVTCLFIVATIALNYFGLLRSAADALVLHSAKTPVAFMFMGCEAVCMVMLLVVGWTSYLLATNQTTIEFHFNLRQKVEAVQNGRMFRNVYDVGTALNLTQVFGPYRHPLQLLLPTLQGLPNDGTVWLQLGEEFDEDF